jgi:Tol biopolymer transport system component
MRSATEGSFLPRWRLTFALLAASALAATGALAPPAQAAFPGANGKIAFTTDRDGNNEIYVKNLDGSGLTRLTNNAASDSDPAWSPDVSQIVFVYNRDGGNFEIYKMNANGSSQTRLTKNSAFDADPNWSSDGTQIAFASDRDGSNFNIFKMSASGDANGTIAPTQLTTNFGHDGFPAWSPDGSKIAFSTDQDGNNEIYTMNTDGTNQIDRTNNPASDTGPSWSPDGGQIAFASDRSGNGDTYKMNADGSSPTDLSTFTNAEHSPAWSPDGRRIAEVVVGTGVDGIFTLSAAGGDTQIFDQPPGHDESPDWQPIVRSYARPKGATPLRVSLVPAYRQCASPNTTHRGSISSPSCYAPTPESSYLTVGTVDFNGQAPNFIGSALFKAVTSPSADGTIAVSTTDIRCQGLSGGCSSGALADYTGDLRFDATFRITDKGNGPFAAGPATNGTVSDIPLDFNVPCATTASTTVGSTCSINTTINSVLGSTAIVAGRRANWQLVGGVNLYDGGSDGVATTTGNNTLFAVGGLFFP